MKIQECSKKDYNRLLKKDVILEFFGSKKFDFLHEDTKELLKKLCKLVPNGVLVERNGIAGICLYSSNTYKSPDGDNFTKAGAKQAMRNWAGIIEEFKQSDGMELVLFFGKKSYGSNLFIPSSSNYADAYVMIQLYNNLAWYDEWKQKPYKKLKV